MRDVPNAEELIGRHAARRVLAKAYRSRGPQLVSVIGRGRIGKTFLVRRYFEREMVFHVTGLAGAAKSFQLRSFRLQLGKAFGAPAGNGAFDNWLDAFAALAEALEVALRKDPERRVVFLDELPWLASARSGFLIIRQLQRWWARPLSEIHREDLLAYQTFCIREKRYSRATMNQVVNGVRAYYERVLAWGKDELRLPRQRKRRTLPNVCSEEQVRRMLRETENTKHRMILAAVYGLGLRRGEVQHLLVGDVNFERDTVHIRQAKGNKDRILSMPRSLRPLFERYLRRYEPEHWFFEGESRGQYSATSIQKIFTRAKQRSGLPSHLTLHGLRHSYATHMVEHGTPLHVVKDLLGHGSIKTTQVYLHTSRQQISNLHDPLMEL